MIAPLAVRSGVAATLTVVNLDASGEGFNDPTPMAPVGGNTGATLGAQRLIAFEYAAGIWATTIASPVEIRIDARFDPLSCSSTSAVLGAAGPTTAHRDFSGAPRPGTWYVQALANKLAGTDLDPASDDIDATFNSSIGTTCAFPRSWYFGLDGNSATAIDFVSVVLHEIGHGLGFLSLVDVTSGAKFLGQDDTYMVYLEDHGSGSTYPTMSDADRAAAAVATGDLHWVGPSVVTGSVGLLSGRHPSGHVEMYAPPSIEVGSSVSHFSTSLAPNELMEPFFTGSIHDPGLARMLLADLGWGPVSCGNGVLDPGEQCDDGNTAGGDCCSSSCAWEAAGIPCSDGDACTSGDTCDATGTCLSGSATDCNDSNPCTDDGCSPAGGCTHTANAAACDDGLQCTTVDGCAGGVCAGIWDAAACALDPFKLYKARTRKGDPRFSKQTLQVGDVFESKSTLVVKPGYVANPASIDGDVVRVPEVALECYKTRDVKGQVPFASRLVESTDVFGTRSLVLRRPRILCAPSAAGVQIAPPPLPPHGVDRYKCYRARPVARSGGPVGISLDDAFESKQARVVRGTELCVPADVGGQGTLRPDDYLACYKIRDEPGQPRFAGLDLFASGDFGDEILTAVKSLRLCVPAAVVDLGPS